MESLGKSPVEYSEMGNIAITNMKEHQVCLSVRAHHSISMYAFIQGSCTKLA